jgi:hypothetical protein
MSMSTTVIHHATLPANALAYVLTHTFDGTPKDSLADYPALAALDEAHISRNAIIFPDNCPNHARSVFIFSELNLPIDTGASLLEAATLGIPQAKADITEKIPARWFSLNPVHWRAERDHVNLIGLSSTQISEDEMRTLVESIAPWLAQWDWHIYVAKTNQWFIRTEAEFDYHAPDLVLAQSGQLESYLPHGSDLKRWQTLLTEIQMLWFNHPINQLRQERGELPINSLWLHSTVHTRQITENTLSLWSTILKSITEAPDGSDIEPHNHLMWLNKTLTPLALTYHQYGHATMTFLGDTWQQNLVLTKPALSERLKQLFKRTRKKPLVWLEQPQFDFLP